MWRKIMAPAAVQEDYYAILEIDTNATPDIIKRAYRRLALVRHPDKHELCDRPDATVSFQQVSYYRKVTVIIS